MTEGGHVPHEAICSPEPAEALASGLVQQLGTWDECMLWVTEWDVWVDKEDWPRFYSWRARYSEKRSLAAAPGHVFQPGETLELQRLLSHALQCGWDTVVLPSNESSPTGTRLRTSHDEWYEFMHEKG